jgi:hypothetical protein
MPNTIPAASEAMRKIPESLIQKYRGNQPIDEYDFAMDLLRTARLALHANNEPGLVEGSDIASISYVMSYAIDSLGLIREEVNGLCRIPAGESE